MIDLKLHLIIDPITLKEIVLSKSETIRRRNYEFKFIKEKHVGLIQDALFPFTNIRYSYEKGFYCQDDGSGGIGGP